MYSTIDPNTQTIGLETITNSCCLTWPKCNASMMCVITTVS